MQDNTQSQRDPEKLLSDQQRCYCPLDGIIDLLSRKYAIQVICVVGALEPVRYSEIETTFGEVSSSTLSTRLTELTEADLLEREQHDTIPPQVEYTLTADGEELCSLLEPLLEWIERRDDPEVD
jgi:DNA-binding HxlR family transcriptional regulator